MKIFLSSTAHDLSDFRALTVSLLERDGHKVIFHENAAFPVRRMGLHSHDQCIEEVSEADLVVCLIDRRYGGRYAGAKSAAFEEQSFNVLGYTKSGKKKKYPIIVQVSDLSITWVELITAYQKSIPVVTFARQRTLDEKDTRRKNQFLSSFSPAYAEKNELFDLLDWITKQKVNNWIAPFNSIVDYEQKLSNCMVERGRPIVIPKKVDEAVSVSQARVCVIVEGETDNLFVLFLIKELKLKNKFVIIKANGKYNVLSNFKTNVAQFAKIYSKVIVLLDSDAESEAEFDQNRRQLKGIISDSGADNIFPFFAHPSIEAWIAAGLPPIEVKISPVLAPWHITKDIFSKMYGPSTTQHIGILLRNEFSYKRAIQNSSDFHRFVALLFSIEPHDAS